MEDFDIDNILIDENSHENILIYDISYKTLTGPNVSLVKCIIRWYRMGIFYSHVYWFFTCILEQILPASIFRQFLS